MQSDEPKRTFYSELAARRSRSARLTELAVAAGLVSAESLAGEDRTTAEEVEEDELEMEMEREVDVPEVSGVADGFGGIGEDEFALLGLGDEAAADAEPGGDAKEVVKEADEGAVAEDPIVAAAEDAFGGKSVEPGPLGASYFAEFGEEKGTEEKVANAAGHAPAAEELIAESEDFLAEEPQMLSDVEKTLAAEIIAERIGQVVDIQRFPKTKPRRVMAKVESEEKARQKKAAEPERSAGPNAPVVSRSGPEQVINKADPAKPVSGALDTPGVDKLKKKRVSLLDNYFRGL